MEIKNAKLMVRVKKELEPESGIIIKEGTHGTLKLDTATNGWPTFETLECGTEWDIALDWDLDIDGVGVLNDYFDIL